MDFIDEFILEYKNNPCLWKADSIHFKNRTKRQEAYSKLIEVAAKHGEHYNVERTKQKINNLRCAFRHQLKKYNESKNKGEKEELYCPKRKYFESLLFLRDEETPEKNKKHILNSPTVEDKVETIIEPGNISEIRVIYDKHKADIISVTNFNEDCETNSSLVQNHSLNTIINEALSSSKPLDTSDIIEYEEIPEEMTEKDVVESHISDNEKDSFDTRKTGRRKRLLSASSQHSNETELNSAKILKIDVCGNDFEKLLTLACRNSNKYAEDNFTNFGKIIAHKLRSMDSVQAMFAEKLITDVIFKGQMKLLSELNVNEFGSFECTSLSNDATADK